MFQIEGPGVGCASEHCSTCHRLERTRTPAGVAFGPDARSGAAAGAAGVSTWGGGVEVFASGPIPKSSFVQQLEAQAAVDFDRGASPRRPPMRQAP
jgi:hypothetical protein